MNIQEAVKKAMEENRLIARSSARVKESDVYAAIKPSNTYDACLLVVIIEGKPERACRCWNPTADDLMADDWTVLRDEFGNEISNIQ